MFACCVCEPKEDELLIESNDVLPEETIGGDAERHLNQQWTSEQKSQEKERLSKLVRKFARNALRGISCTYFDQSSGKKSAAILILDKAVKSISIKVGTAEQNFAMSDLHEVFTWELMAATPKLHNFTKMRTFEGLKQEEKESLVMLECVEQNQYLQRICLMDDHGPAAARDFASCIQILRLFSVTPSPR
eukprot:Lankesteria_metandrocarpae@DN4959_c0_g2_i2.p1